MLPLSPRHFWYHFDDAVIRNDFSMGRIWQNASHKNRKFHICSNAGAYIGSHLATHTHSSITQHTFDKNRCARGAASAKTIFWFAENILTEAEDENVKEANKSERIAWEDESEHEFGTAVRSIQLQTLYLLPLNRTVLFQFSFFPYEHMIRRNIFGALAERYGNDSAATEPVRCTLELPANNSMQIQLHLHSFTVSIEYANLWICRHRKAMKHTLAICQIDISREKSVCWSATGERCLHFEMYKQSVVVVRDCRTTDRRYSREACSLASRHRMWLTHCRSAISPFATTQFACSIRFMHFRKSLSWHNDSASHSLWILFSLFRQFSAAHRPFSARTNIDMQIGHTYRAVDMHRRELMWTQVPLEIPHGITLLPHSCRSNVCRRCNTNIFLFHHSRAASIVYWVFCAEIVLMYRNVFNIFLLNWNSHKGTRTPGYDSPLPELKR